LRKQGGQKRRGVLERGKTRYLRKSGGRFPPRKKTPERGPGGRMKKNLRFI